MSKCTNARLVFIRLACVMVAISFAICSCVAGSTAQWTSNYGSNVQGSPSPASQAMPEDWPQTISVPGMEKVTGLVQGQNNLSYSINVVSQDSGKVNFLVKAFCVYNPTSDYAILHVLEQPLSGVVDEEKKTLQIDFSSLDTGLKSVNIIDKADVDKVLMQEKDTLVLNTVMSVDSMDGSQVKFSITDMSLLQPDGVLNEFALPGPVPAVYSPETDRFSTVAFPEMTEILQQNYVLIQQNTYISVVNQINVVNVVNVVDFGGFGYGGWGGYPYGGYGGYGGYDGYGGYGGYGGYDGYGGYGGYGGYDGYGGYNDYGYGHGIGGTHERFMPYTDPLPVVRGERVAPLEIPHDVPVYSARPTGLADDLTPVAVKKPAGEKRPDPRSRVSDTSPTVKVPDTYSTVRPDARTVPSISTATRPAVPTTTVTQSRPDPRKTSDNVKSTSTPAQQGFTQSAPSTKTTLSKPAASKKAAAPVTTQPATTVTQSRPDPRKASDNVKSVSTPAKQTVTQTAPSTKTAVTKPSTSKKAAAPVTTQPATTVTQSRPDTKKTSDNVKSVSTPAKQTTTQSSQPVKTAVTKPSSAKTTSPATSKPATTMTQNKPDAGKASGSTKAASAPAKKTTTQSAPVKQTVTKTKAPDSQQAQKAVAKSAPATKVTSAPKTAKAPASTKSVQGAAAKPSSQKTTASAKGGGKK